MAQSQTPLDMIPTNLASAIENAQKSNPALRSTQLAAEIASQDTLNSDSDGYYPTLDAVAASEYKDDDAGTVGSQVDQSIKLHLKYSFDFGFTVRNYLKAARSGQLAAEKRYADARVAIEEQVRNAWNNLQTAQATAEFLCIQANIAGEFLELARRERQLGTRSLIDVLSGETALINSYSDAAYAETDVALAVYQLLAGMGKLEVAILR
jgi:adhesin transport system outer membrane protein